MPAPNPHLQAKALTSDQLPHSVPRWDASSTDLPHSQRTLREQGPGPRPHMLRAGTLPAHGLAKLPTWGRAAALTATLPPQMPSE